MKKILYNDIRLLPPKSDIVFKALFGNEKDKSLLVSFVNGVIGLNIESEEQLEIVNSEMNTDSKDDKFTRLDLRIKVLTGGMIHIEIQIIDEKDIVPRALLYHSQNVARQLKRGEKYKDITKTLSLIIIDFELFEEKELWYNINRYMNVETGKILTDLSEICFLELPKAKKNCLKKEQLNERELWSLFLSSETAEEIDMLAEQSPVFKNVVKKLMYVSEDEKMQYLYDMREKAEIDYYSRMASAEERGRNEGVELGRNEGIELGRNEGIELGRNEGIELGRNEGIELGRNEGIKLGRSEGMLLGIERGKKQGIIQMIKSMKMQGVDLNVIAECSGLTIDEVRNV